MRLAKLFEVVAKSLDVSQDDLEAVDQRIRVKGNPDKGMSFVQACQKLGVNSISEMGANEPNKAPQEGLNTGGVGGVQMADVSVDTETGIVRMNRLVAVQDCGLVVNPKTAESQVYGACIMSVCGALYEERIMDEQTGRVLNLRHGVLQAGRDRRYRRDHRPHGYPRGERQARRGGTRGAVRYWRYRGHRERGRQCHWSESAARAAYTGTSAGRAR